MRLSLTRLFANSGSSWFCSAKPIDTVKLRAILQNRSLNRVLKVPIPADTVQNPLFGMKVSEKIISRIKSYAKLKISMWGIITGLTYYFTNWMWAVIPGVITISKLLLHNRRNTMMNNQIRSIILVDPETIRIEKFDRSFNIVPINQVKFKLTEKSADLDIEKRISFKAEFNNQFAILTLPEKQVVLSNADVMLALLTGRQQSFPDIKITDGPEKGYGSEDLIQEQVARLKKVMQERAKMYQKTKTTNSDKPNKQ